MTKQDEPRKNTEEFQNIARGMLSKYHNYDKNSSNSRERSVFVPFHARVNWIKLTKQPNGEHGF